MLQSSHFEYIGNDMMVSNALKSISDISVRKCSQGWDRAKGKRKFSERETYDLEDDTCGSSRCARCVHSKPIFECKSCVACPHDRIISACRECTCCPHGDLAEECLRCDHTSLRKRRARISVRETVITLSTIDDISDVFQHRDLDPAENVAYYKIKKMADIILSADSAN